MIPIIKRWGLWGELLNALKSPKHLKASGAGAFFISVNWLLFIIGVNSNEVIQISLGYFICPLAAVLFGILFFGERLRIAQVIACTLALLGVIHQAKSIGQIPWLSLGVAITFAFYGVIRKAAKIHALVSLTVDNILLFPIALGYLLICHGSDKPMYLYNDMRLDILLLLSGAITAVPLLWYSIGAQRLTLKTLGFLHYLAPSLQLALGVLIYAEPFNSDQQLSFIIIWSGVAVFMLDNIFQQTRRRSVEILDEI